jgi:hypothetical protein
MPKGRGFRDRYLGATPASTLVFNKESWSTSSSAQVFSRAISRGIRLTNGIVVNFLHVISFYNVLLISRRMATNALSSKMGTRISVRVPPTTPQ